MKYTLFFFAAFFVIISPTFGELTSQDLDKIRLIVKEEVSEVRDSGSEQKSLNLKSGSEQKSLKSESNMRRVC